MKKSIFIIVTLTLLVFISCGEKIVEQPPKKPSDKPTETTECKRTIWVNPDVECCDVKDPLNNLEWILQTPRFNEYKTALYSFANYILLFKNNTTHEDFVVFNIKDKINYVIIYDCNGNILDGGEYNYINKNVSNNINATPPEPCDICDDFFENHILVDTIAYSIVYF